MSDKERLNEGQDEDTEGSIYTGGSPSDEPGPEAEGFRPKGEGFRPKGEGFRPKGEGFRPKGEGFRPKGE